MGTKFSSSSPTPLNPQPLDDELSAATKHIQNCHSQWITKLLCLVFELLDSIYTAQEFLLSQPMHSLIPLEERTRIVRAQSYEELLEVCSGKFRWYDSMALEELFEFIQRNGLEIKTKDLKDKILEGVLEFFRKDGRIIKDPSSGDTTIMVDSFLRQSDSDEYMKYKLRHLARGALSLKKDDVLKIQDTQTHKEKDLPIDQVGDLSTRIHKTSLIKRTYSDDSSLGDSISDADADMFLFRQQDVV